MSEPQPPPRSASRLRSIAPGLIAAALSILVYLPTLSNGFAYDDAFLLRSPLLAHPWSLREIFSGGFYEAHERYLGLYRPLGQASLVWNALLARSLCGSIEHPSIFHAVNVLLHAAASFLVFVWLSRLPLSRWVAGATAILWAVHPVHAEVAANITARYESLAAIFGLGFLIAHRSRSGIVAGVLLLVALLCKESAVVFLPLGLAVDAIFPVEGRRFEARSFVPSCAAVALWFVLRSIALSGESPATPYVENPVAAASLSLRLPTAARAQLLYLRDQILPLWLSTDHSFAQTEVTRSFLDTGCLLFVAILAAAIALGWLMRSRRPDLLLGLCGYAIAFSLGSNFLAPIGTIMADRLAYVPSVFTCLLAATLFSLALPRALGNGAIAVAAVLLSISSVKQIPQWKDDLTLFRRQVATAPKSAKSHGNLGNALREKGELREAVEEYKKSIQIYPFRPEPHAGLAQTYDSLGEDPELLINTWADAIRYGTLGERPVLQTVLALVDLGRWEDLSRLRVEMMTADPKDAFLVHVSRILHAAERLMRVPTQGEEWMRANVLLRMKDYAAAEAKYRLTLHRGALPEYEIPQALQNLATCHEALGHPERAQYFRGLAAGQLPGR